MKFCSECGHSIDRDAVSVARKQCVCPACGITHYENPKVIVCAVISWRNEILLCRRAIEPARGLWSVPCGYLECGESLQEGAARETLEETGVNVDPRNLELCAVMNMTAIDQVAIAFRASLEVKPTIHCGAECSAAAFLARSDIVLEDCAWIESLGDRPQCVIDELASDRFSIWLMNLASNGGTTFTARKYPIRSRNDGKRRG